MNGASIHEAWYHTALWNRALGDRYVMHTAMRKEPYRSETERKRIVLAEKRVLYNKAYPCLKKTVALAALSVSSLTFPLAPKRRP